jgi:predicted SAM-dependent methyltransferase
MNYSIKAIEKENQKRQKYKWRELIVNNISFVENSIGAKIYQKKINSKYAQKYLNLGCGESKFEGWVNADIYKFYKIIMGREPWPDWMLDATKPWNCPDEFWGGIYCSHTIEHIKYIDVIALFKEAYRTLASEKWIRIVVPDLNKYIKYYTGEASETEFEKFSYKALAVSDLTQNWGHISAWDEYLLIDLLQEIGFVNVTKVDYQKGTDSQLFKDEYIANRRWESLYVEAQKP